MTHVLVTGANGRTGRRIIARLLARGQSVRAFVRREEAARELQTMGVSDCFLGNLEQESDLQKAVQGMVRVIHVCPPMHPQEDQIGINLIAAAKDAGVKLFVEYSVLHPVIDVPHHRRKLIVEEALINSGLPYVILQPSRYMQHLNVIWEGVVRDGKHVLPFSTQSRFNLVDLEDLAEAACLVLDDPQHISATYQLAGPEALSMEDCAAQLSTLLGKNVSAVERKPAEFRKAMEAAGVPAARLAGMETMNGHYTAHGLLGNPNVLRWILGREPTRFDAFVKRELLR